MRTFHISRLQSLGFLAAALIAPAMAQSLRVPLQDTLPMSTNTTTKKDGKSTTRHCAWAPMWGNDCIDGYATATDKIKARNDYVNDFWSTAQKFSYFNQFKSIYNGASGSDTVAADLASLNFAFGGQLVAGTNLIAAPSAPSTASSGLVPTLAGTSSAQAAQDVLHGGTLNVALAYPVLAIGQAMSDNPGNLMLRVDLLARQGIDIQSFKSGTNISVTSPPTHTTGGMEWYLIYNSTNADSTGKVVGAFFLGGSYGYDYTSHEFARDYGFGPRLSRGVGEISMGLLINKVATIRVSRAFGPAQTFIDSTTNVQRSVDNFKAWSIGITYQSKTN